MTIIRTTFQAPQLLLHRLKVQAAREQTDVSRLLCKIAEAYLKEHEMGDPLFESMGPDISKFRHQLPELLEKLKVAQKVGRETDKQAKKARARKGAK